MALDGVIKWAYHMAHRVKICSEMGSEKSVHICLTVELFVPTLGLGHSWTGTIQSDNNCLLPRSCWCHSGL